MLSQVDDLYLSVVTIGELRKGFTLLSPSDNRRVRLEQWFHDDLLALENGGAKLDHKAANRSCFWAE